MNQEQKINSKLQSLVKAMGALARLKRGCSVKVARKFFDRVEVEVTFLDDELREDPGSSSPTKFVLIDVGKWHDRELVELCLGDVRVLVSAAPAAVLAVALEL